MDAQPNMRASTIAGGSEGGETAVAVIVCYGKGNFERASTIERFFCFHYALAMLRLQEQGRAIMRSPQKMGKHGKNRNTNTSIKYICMYEKWLERSNKLAGQLQMKYALPQTHTNNTLT